MEHCRSRLFIFIKFQWIITIAAKMINHTSQDTWWQ